MSDDIIDISKIPSTCTFSIFSGTGFHDGDFCCRLEEVVRGRTIKSWEYANTPQEAVDKAIESFTGNG